MISTLTVKFQDFSHIIALGIKSDLNCQDVGQGQPRIIICAILVGPTSPMLHTKSQGLIGLLVEDEEYF